MPLCGSLRCGCALTTSGGISLDGAGTAINPWVLSLGEGGGLGLREVLVYDTVGTDTFTKATYPWLRAVRVRCQGGGGGSGGCDVTGAGENAIGRPGGGGGYGESFILASTLGASVTITVGAGGAGGAAGENAGSSGGNSSFGTLVVGDGGGGGDGGNDLTPPQGAVSGLGGGGTGDIVVPGGSSDPVMYLFANRVYSNSGGDSFLGAGARGISTGTTAAAQTGLTYGGGAAGAINAENQATALAGAAGAQGVVIVELYA